MSPAGMCCRRRQIEGERAVEVTQIGERRDVQLSGERLVENGQIIGIAIGGIEGLAARQHVGHEIAAGGGRGGTVAARVGDVGHQTRRPAVPPNFERFGAGVLHLALNVARADRKAVASGDEIRLLGARANRVVPDARQNEADRQDGHRFHATRYVRRFDKDCARGRGLGKGLARKLPM